MKNCTFDRYKAYLFSSQDSNELLLFMLELLILKYYFNPFYSVTFYISTITLNEI